MKVFTLPSNSTAQAPKYQTSQRSVMEKIHGNHPFTKFGMPPSPLFILTVIRSFQAVSKKFTSVMQLIDYFTVHHGLFCIRPKQKRTDRNDQLQYFKFSQRHWRFNSSGVLLCVDRYTVIDISKERTVPSSGSSKPQRVDGEIIKKKTEHSSGT